MTFLRKHWLAAVLVLVALVVAICVFRHYQKAKKNAQTPPGGLLAFIKSAGALARNAPPATSN